MARNVELLTKVRDLVKAEPTKLNMGLWAAVSVDEIKLKNGFGKVSCGTTACIAGWAVQLAGDKLVAYDYEVPEPGDSDFGETTVIDVEYCVARNGRINLIDDRAQRLLGLTLSETQVLFTCGDGEAVNLLNVLIAGGSIDD